MSSETAPDVSRELELPPSVKKFFSLCLVFIGLSALFHLVSKFVFHHHGYSAWPLQANSYYRFRDFTVYFSRFEYFHTADFFNFTIPGAWPFVYPAPVAVVCEFFFRFMRPHALLAFVTFILLTVTIPAILFCRALQKRGIAGMTAVVFTAVLFIFSWPILLIVDGANTEATVWLALVIGMWAYATGRGWTAAAFFGVAAALKLFPFVFLGLFLSTRQWKKLLFGVAVFFAVSLVSLAIVGPTIPLAIKGILDGLTFFKVIYFVQWRPLEQGVDHSLLAFIKMICVLVFGLPADHLERVLAIYSKVTVIGGLLLYFLWIQRLPRLNQIIALTIASIYFTAFSGDGTLIHLYYGLAMLIFLAIDAYRKGIQIRGLQVTLYCFAFLVSPETFLIHHGLRFIGPAKAIALAFLFVAVLRYPFGPVLREDRREDSLANPDASAVTQLHA